MSQSRTDLRDRVFQAVDDLNQQRPLAERLAKSLDTPLTGENGTLDSLAFVNFIVALEQRHEGAFDTPLSLLDDERLDPTADRFRTVGALVEFLQGLQTRA